MDKYHVTRGEGRTKVSLIACRMGSESVVWLYNENAHVGAVAVGEYDRKQKRASTSVITRLGHKDDAVAQNAAYLISKGTKRATCVIAGIHLDNITEVEIAEVMENASSLVNDLVNNEIENLLEGQKPEKR